MEDEQFGFDGVEGFGDDIDNATEHSTEDDESDDDDDDFASVGGLNSSKEESFDYLRPSAVSKSGWMKKKGGGKQSGSRHQGSMFARKNWKKRWFELSDTFLKYYKSNQSHIGKPLGVININDKCQVEVGKGAHFTLVTPKRSYSFEAESNKDAGDWVAALTDAVNAAELDSLAL